jgi:putative toxin-antitoxin system antitoxin component (TIGR02293 family)
MATNPRIVPARAKGQRSLAAAKLAAAVATKARRKGLYKVAGGKAPEKTSEKKEPEYLISAIRSVAYADGDSIRGFVKKIRGATPMQLVGIEREGVRGRLLKDIAQEMAIPASRLFTIIGVPKATAEKKASSNEVIAGAGGQAALGLVRLLGIAQSIVDDSTADAARSFDAAKWLGRWIERPQPALGGKKPADLLDTPTGLEVVSRTLGAIESGAYL